MSLVSDLLQPRNRIKSVTVIPGNLHCKMTDFHILDRALSLETSLKSVEFGEANLKEALKDFQDGSLDYVFLVLKQGM
jgi:hypothetical protein